MVRAKPQIAVAMSGGVDSAVAAALMKKEGLDVIGLFAKTWTPQPGDGTTCTWVADRRDALRVAAHLDIPLVTVEAEAVYRREVVEPWVAGYGRGETPNPDVWCNRTVKFGVLLEKARELGAAQLATGHYARIEDARNPKSLPRRQAGEIQKPKTNLQTPYTLYPTPYTLLRGIDRAKDQSYFLWDIEPSVLPKIRFPIGHLRKAQVRQLARRFGLPVADKKDSQGICLLGPTDIRTFFRRRLPNRPGPIYDWTTGRLIGRHDGLAGLTIGQRHKVQISDIRYQRSDNQRLVANRKPVYIVAIDRKHNALWMGPSAALLHRKLTSGDANWLDQQMEEHLKTGLTVAVEAQIRYRQRPTRATIRSGDKGRLEVIFSQPVTAPTLGQSVVFYDGERLLGGAIIKQVAGGYQRLRKVAEGDRNAQPPLTSINLH